MLPDFDENGNLPPGEHRAALEEIVSRYSVHSWRTRGPLTKGFQEYVGQLMMEGITRVYVDGSYITAKLAPSDVDVTLIFSADFDLGGQAWRFGKRTWRKRGLDIHLFRENDIGLERHLRDWQTDPDRHLPKGIIILERRP